MKAPLLRNQRRQGGSKMADYVKVAVDAMGGDNAPAEIVKGAVEAIQAEKKIKVFLVGKEEQVKAELAKYTYPQEQVEVVNATEVIAMGGASCGGHPQQEGFLDCKGSLYGKGRKMRCLWCPREVREPYWQADRLSWDAARVWNARRWRRSFLRKREPPFSLTAGPMWMPGLPSWCSLQKWVSIYMENVMGIKKPRVGIVNIGAEEEKGNALVKETFPLLKECAISILSAA